MTNLFICAICQREFKNRNGLYRHQHNTHNITTKEYIDKYIDTTDHKCPYCQEERTFRKTYYSPTCSNKACILKNREAKVMEHYGVKNPSQSEIIKDKKAKTCITNYGVPVPAKSKLILKKMGDTCEKRYGVRNIYELPSVKNKSLETRMNNREEWIAKFLKSNRDNHGGIHYFQTEESQKHRFHKITYNGVNYDSSWEVAFVRYLEENNYQYTYHPCKIEYSHNGEKHFYFPGFKIGDKLVEIKSDYLFNQMTKNTGTLENSKYQCMLNNDVIILTSKELKALAII